MCNYWWMNISQSSNVIVMLMMFKFGPILKMHGTLSFMSLCAHFLCHLRTVILWVNLFLTSCSNARAQVDDEDTAVVNLIRSDDWVGPQTPFNLTSYFCLPACLPALY